MDNYKQYLAKYFTNLVSIISLAGMIYLGFHEYRAQERSDAERKLLEERYSKLIDTKTDFEQITAEVGQLSTLYEEQKKLAEDVSMVWKELVVEREERIKSSTTTVVTVDPLAEKQTDSDYTFKTPNGTKGYTLNELRIAGKDSPAIGYVLIDNSGSVYKKNYKFEIRVESVQIKDDLTGKVRVVSRAYLVPQENGLADSRRPDLKKWTGEKYALHVTGGETVVDPQEPVMPEIKTQGWVPWALNLNGGFGVFGAKGGDLDTKATIDTNLMGYGYSKRDLDWKLLQVGANYSKVGGLGFHFMPFSYRPLKSVFTNTYLGPGVYTTPDEHGYFVGINIGF